MYGGLHFRNYRWILLFYLSYRPIIDFHTIINVKPEILAELCYDEQNSIAALKVSNEQGNYFSE